MVSLNKLTEIKDLRKVWANEAQDFTPWLAEEENIALLSDAVGIDISVEGTESSVGGFSVDIFAKEAGTDRKIIIENQLEDSNHDHLGKLITYASGKDAEVVIWLVKKAREEHRAAIEWLNAHTDEKLGFFLCEIKLYKIGDSEPAVKFEVIEKPNDWVKEIKKVAPLNETLQTRLDYWSAFNDYAFTKGDYGKIFKKHTPSTDHWYTLNIGSSACSIVLSLIKKYGNILTELYITDDKALYKKLYSKKDVIESELGLKLEWCELPNRKASRIIISKTIDYSDKTTWNEQFDWMMDMSKRFRKVFKSYI